MVSPALVKRIRTTTDNDFIETIKREPTLAQQQLNQQLKMPSTANWKRVNGRLVRVESVMDCPAVRDYLASLRPTKKDDIIGTCEGCRKGMTAEEVDAIPPSIFHSDWLTCAECAKEEEEGAMEAAMKDEMEGWRRHYVAEWGMGWVRINGRLIRRAEWEAIRRANGQFD